MTLTSKKPELSGRVYTMADRPAEISPELWQMAIEQGVVESSRGENVMNLDVNLFESDEEYDKFMAYIAVSRASKV